VITAARFHVSTPAVLSKSAVSTTSLPNALTSAKTNIDYQKTSFQKDKKGVRQRKASVGSYGIQVTEFSSFRLCVASVLQFLLCKTRVAQQKADYSLNSDDMSEQRCFSGGKALLILH
jgi:hypothetical protein